MVFVALTGLNLTLVFPELHAIQAYVVVLPVHAIFWIRVGRARWAAAGQRAMDLETFRAIKSTQDAKSIVAQDNDGEIRGSITGPDSIDFVYNHGGSSTVVALNTITRQKP